MITIFAAVALMQVSIPGATGAVAVTNSRVTSDEFMPQYPGLIRNPIFLVSDDGEMALGGSGGIHRAPLFRRGGFVGGEDVFFARLENGEPYSLTTSQAAHPHLPMRIGLRRESSQMACAPLGDVALLTSVLDDGSLRLTVVNLLSRTERPNVDYETANLAGQQPKCVAAIWDDGEPVWYVRVISPDGSGQIMKFIGQGSLERRVVGTTPTGMVVEAYDPSSGAILGSRNSQGEVSSSAVGSSEFSRIGSAGELSADFLWRGDVYATTENATLKLDEHDEWRPFCPYRVIGASANGRFWVVLGSDGTAWRVTF